MYDFTFILFSFFKCFGIKIYKNYVELIFTKKKTDLGESWYLANDMQFYWIASIMLILLIAFEYLNNKFRSIIEQY